MNVQGMYFDQVSYIPNAFLQGMILVTLYHRIMFYNTITIQYILYIQCLKIASTKRYKITLIEHLTLKHHLKNNKKINPKKLDR